MMPILPMGCQPCPTYSEVKIKREREIKREKESERERERERKRETDD